MSRERLEDPPRWVREVYENDGWKLEDPEITSPSGAIRGSTKLSSERRVYRQLKSSYYDTTRNEESCPNC